MKVHDQLEFADLQNLASAPASPTVGRIYFDTVLGAFRYWDGAAWRSIANIAQAQTLTNKTLTSPVISQISNTGTITLPTATDTLVGRATTDTLSNKTFSDAPTLSSGGRFAQISTPVSPSSGFNNIYPKSDGYFYSQDSTGAERKIGSGAGGIEYIQNTDFESGVANYTAYANAAATPTTGSGGVPTLTLVKSTTTPLRGTASGLLTPGALGDGVATTIAIDKADQAKMLTVSFDYQVVSGTLADGDYTVWAYDVTNSLRLQLAPFKVLGNLGFGKFQGTFQTSSNSTSYRILIHQAVASTATIRIDNVSCQPIVKLFGAPVTDWIAITPVCSWTSATESGKMRRSGDSMELEVELTGGSLNATGTLSLSPPSGYVFDTSKFVAGNSVVGVGYASHSGSVYTAVAILIDSTHIQFYGYNTNGWAAGTPFAWNATDNLSFSVRVPIQGWSSSVVMSNDADTRVTALSAHILSSTTITSSTPLKFTTLVKDTHAGYNSSTGAYVAPSPGMYNIGFSGIYSTGGCDVHLYVNGVDVGLFGYIGNSDRKGSAVSYYLNAGDSVTIVPAQSISTADTEGFLSICKLSGSASIAASESVNARAYQTGGQTAFTALTVIALDTKDYDTHGGLTLGAGSRYTAQTPGKYRLSWTVTSGNVAWTVGQSLIVMPYKNGAQAPGLPQDTCIAMAAGTYRQTSRGSVTLNLLTGDYIDLRATADVTQSPLTAGTWMEVERIGN